jgi:ribose transport system permease protein
MLRWIPHPARFTMPIVLVALCIAFSVATLTLQPPNAQEASEQILKKLGTPPISDVLVVASTSPEDSDFAKILQGKLLRLGVSQEQWREIFIQGIPLDARKAIGRRTEKTLTIVQSPDTASWTLFNDLAGKFPDKDLSVIAPESRWWPVFLKSQNLINIVNQIVIIAILAVGMTLVILTGGIDLSVGSLIALSAVLCTLAVRDWGGGEQADTFAMILCGLFALLVCGLCGLLNGLLVVRYQIPPFIATLAMMLIASGAAFLLSKGQSINAVPESFVWLGRGEWLGLPVAVLLMIVLYVFTQFAMRSTVYGRAIYAIGGNIEASRLCGIHVRSLITSTYVICALLAGLGGLVMASRLKSGNATYGVMYELYVIAAVVVGGTSLRGGYGSVIGTLIGALIIAVIENGMNLIQIESYTQKVVFGIVILGAVLFDRHTTRRNH